MDTLKLHPSLLPIISLLIPLPPGSSTNPAHNAASFDPFKLHHFPLAPLSQQPQQEHSMVTGSCAKAAPLTLSSPRLGDALPPQLFLLHIMYSPLGTALHR